MASKKRKASKGGKKSKAKRKKKAAAEKRGNYVPLKTLKSRLVKLQNIVDYRTSTPAREKKYK